MPAADLSLRSLAFLPWFLFGTAAAVSWYAFFSYFQRTLQGKLVRALFAANAYGPESARRLSELGLTKKRRYTVGLRGGALGRAVVCVDPDSNDPAYYLSSQSPDRTRAQFCVHAGTILVPVLVTIFAFCLAVLAYLVLPQLIDFSA